VKNRLQQNGIRCSIVSLESFSQITDEWNWNYELILNLVQELTISNVRGSRFYDGFSDIRTEIRKDTLKALSWFKALDWFIDEIVLREISSQVVIIFDDIESLGSDRFLATVENQQLFKDNFFQQLFIWHEKRNNRFPDISELYQRLTIVLSGSILSCDLVKDRDHKLFKEKFPEFLLGDFQQRFLEDDLPAWLKNITSPKKREAIFTQTNGHPALTSQFFTLLHTDQHQKIENLVSDTLIPEWQLHLEEIRDKVIKVGDQSCVDLYNSVLRGENIDANPDDLNQHRLVAFGVAVWEQSSMKIHNLIFQKIAAALLVGSLAHDPNDSEASTDLMNQIAPIPDTTSSEEANETPQETQLNSDTEDTTSPPESVFSQENNEDNTRTSNLRKILRWITSPLGIIIVEVFLAILIGILTEINPIQFLPVIILLTPLLILFSLERGKTGAVNDSIEWLLQRIVGRQILYRRLLLSFFMGISIGFLFSCFRDVPSEWGAKILEDEAIVIMKDFWKNETSQIEVLEKAIELGMKAEWYHNFLNQPTPISPILALQSIQHNIIQSDTYKLGKFKSFQNVAANTDGKVIAAVGTTKFGNSHDSGGWIAIWNGSEKSPVMFYSSQGQVNDLILSSDGKFLVTAGNGSIKIWDTKDGKEIDEILWEGSVKSAVNSIELGAKNSYIAATAADGFLKIWKLNSDFKHDSDPIFRQVEIPSQQILNSSSKLVIFNKTCLIATRTVHRDKGSLFKVWKIGEGTSTIESTSAFSDNGDQKPKIIFRQEPSLDTLPENLTESLSISRVSNQIAIAANFSLDGSQKGIVNFWQFDPDSSSCFVYPSQDPLIISFPISSIRFSKDGKYLYTMGKEGLLVWRKSTTGNQWKEVPIKQLPQTLLNPIGEDSRAAANSEDWTAGKIYSIGNTKFITAVNGNLQLWNLEPKKEQLSVREPSPFSKSSILGITSRVGKYRSKTIAVLTKENVRFLSNDLTEKEVLRDHGGEIPTFESVASSFDNEHLVTGNRDGSVQFWEWSSDRPEQGFENFSVGKGKKIVSIAFDPKMTNRLAVATSSYVQLYTTAGEKDGSPISNLRQIQSVEFSPDGKYLAIQCDNFLRIWEVSGNDRMEVPLSRKTVMGSWSFADRFRSLLALITPKEINFLNDRKIQAVHFYPSLSNPNQTTFAVLLKDRREINFWSLLKPDADSNQQNTSVKVQHLGTVDAEALGKKIPNQLFQSSNFNLVWDKMYFFKKNPSEKDTKATVYMAAGGNNEFLIWALNEQSLANDADLAQRLLAVFQESWGKVTSLNFASDRDVLIGTDAGRLIKIQLGEWDTIKWGCEWLLNNNSNSHRKSSTARKCDTWLEKYERLVSN